MEKTYSETEIHEVAQWLWPHIKNNKIVALHGNMGAGKTTLVHALSQFLKVKDTVSSPTFSIINEYEFEHQGAPQFIYHIDLYRLKNEEEAIQAGVEDCLYSNHYCLVEWPERAAALFPPNTLHLYIQVAANQKRHIKIKQEIVNFETGGHSIH